MAFNHTLKIEKKSLSLKTKLGFPFPIGSFCYEGTQHFKVPITIIHMNKNINVDENTLKTKEILHFVFFNISAPKYFSKMAQHLEPAYDYQFSN